MYLPWNSQWFFKVAFSVDAVGFFVYLLIFFGIILHNSFYYSLCMLKIMKIWFSPVVRNSSKNWHSSQSSIHTQIYDHGVYVSLLSIVSRLSAAFYGFFDVDCNLCYCNSCCSCHDIRYDHIVHLVLQKRVISVRAHCHKTEKLWK